MCRRTSCTILELKVFSNKTRWPTQRFLIACLTFVIAFDLNQTAFNLSTSARARTCTRSRSTAITVSSAHELKLITAIDMPGNVESRVNPRILGDSLDNSMEQDIASCAKIENGIKSFLSQDTWVISRYRWMTSRPKDLEISTNRVITNSSLILKFRNFSLTSRQNFMIFPNACNNILKLSVISS